MLDIKYFFIVGVGRSGTTLLMSMLNAHPAIAVPPEFHFIGQHIVGNRPKSYAEMMRLLKSDKRFARLKLSVFDVLKPFQSSSDDFSVVDVYKTILVTYAKREGVSIIGDKAPKNIEYLPVIKQIVPTAYVIHLIRDPRDVYLSRTKSAWSSERGELLQYLAYRSQYQLGRKIGFKLLGTRYLEVHYENILDRPKQELERICEFLDVPYAAEMLDFCDSARKLVAQDEMKWKREAIGPLLTENKKKWLKELTPEEIVRIENACLPTFKDGYYKRLQTKHTILTKLTCKILNMLMAAITAFYIGLVMTQNWKAIHALKKCKNRIFKNSISSEKEIDSDFALIKLNKKNG
jgi:hypothetical protein